MGYRISAVVSKGKDVLNKAFESPPDLVLMDIKLDGEMDGIEAARKLKDGHGIPVVYLTAYADNFTLSSIMKMEPSGYVLKPFSLKELRYPIEVALSECAQYQP